MSKIPSGISTYNLLHYAQSIRNARFEKYDWGTQENIRRYGQPEAPEYQLAKIRSTDIALIWSWNDFLADPDDVQQLVSSLTGKSNL